MSSDPGNLVGAVLSRRFRLVKKLGEGGMGAVYAAESLADAQRVAIKILHPEFLGTLEVLTRFLDEGRLCQRLVHPNILRVHEAAEAEDGSPYLVMELLDGVPLSAYTANGGRVPPTQAVPILQGILAGLATAHAQGIVHRDLKPENVFLARDAAGQFAVKVLDFGIAKVMDAAGGMGSKTKTGMLLGTPAYMSPEQVKNAKDVDARADLWSAGVMFYEMLSGRVAFPAPTEYARLTAILTREPEPLERVEPQLAPFSAFVKQALMKSRDARFQSALEMARGLTAALAGIAVDDAQQQHSRLAVPAPLHRLPDVPSVFVSTTMSASPAAYPSEPSLPVPTSPTAATAPAAPPPYPGGNKLPERTLASKVTPVVPAILTPTPIVPPHVLVVPAGPVPGGTLPSQDLPMLAPVARGAPRFPRGVAPYVAIVLIVVALLAGFFLGYGVAKNM